MKAVAEQLNDYFNSVFAEGCLAEAGNLSKVSHL